MARAGWGVYTLIWTNIILNLTKTLAFFVASRWVPAMHFDRHEVAPYLRYGMYVAFSGTFQRMFQAVDKFIVGRFFGPSQLGIYDNAMTIASMPLDKIWPIYQQVVFPLFARLQREGNEAYVTCLSVLRHYLLVVGPIYLGAAVTAPEFIEVVLGSKWDGMIPWFRAFCLAKLCETLVAYHSTFYNATGRQKQVTRFSLIVLIAIPAAIVPAASFSFELVVIPWITLYPLLTIGWILIGLRKNGLPVRDYLLGVWEGLMGALLMAAVLVVVKIAIVSYWHPGAATRLVVLVVLGIAVFGLFLVSFQRKLVNEALGVLMSRRVSAAQAH
jgi:O-antigen/teichoic acid export membrane protein